MILNGGELDGVRLLGRKSVELMRAPRIDWDGDGRLSWLSGSEFGTFLLFRRAALLDALLLDRQQRAERAVLDLEEKVFLVLEVVVHPAQADAGLAGHVADRGLAETLVGLSDNPIVILLLINLVLLMVGIFMDMTPAVLICTPIFLQVMEKIGKGKLSY